MSTKMMAIGRHAYRYALALGFVTLAFWLRSSLTPLIGHDSPYMIFSPAALLAARFCGLGPGLFALLAGLILGDYFFTPPIHFFGPYAPEELTLIVTYAITTVAGVVLFYRVQRAKGDLEQQMVLTEKAAEESRRRGEELEREVIVRRQAEQALKEAKNALSEYAHELEHRVTERTVKLHESLRSLESVLYHVAHDLRSPLRAMQGFTTMLATEYSANLDDVGKDYATRVGQAATRMDKLLNDLLEYGRVCQVEPIFARVNLDQELSLTLKKFAGIIHNSKADVEVQRPLPAIWADRYLLELVLTHLLSNALKFVPSDRRPQIRIWPEKPNDRAIRIWFQDNGIGIPVEQHERIFRIFERLQQDKWDQSTGIGLAIVEKAVRRMEGDVGLESTPGNGSKFWIELRLPGAV